MEHQASYWEYNPQTKKIACRLCPQFCQIGEGKLGLCKTRINRDGVLYARNYGKVTAVALDPIEKKPLYHFYPGSRILSLGTLGCNMRCDFCQNYHISQQETVSRSFAPEDVLEMLEEIEDNIGIAFTYNEPLMWYEFVLETSKLLKAEKPETKIVLVTNGYLNQEPLTALLPFVDALNIDLKAFQDTTYRKLCGASLEPVQKTINIAAKTSHLEVTTLMVTGENDTADEIEAIARFLAAVNPDIPLHLSRYFPNYKMTKEATPVARILEAQEQARKHLRYVYTGNLPGYPANTLCPRCGAVLIERKYYQTKLNIKEPYCLLCGEKIPIIF
jgi:pyruvate formate lyase activating enzyme